MHRCDRRTTQYVGYAKSQKWRPGIESILSWVKNVETFRKTRLRGVERLDWMFKLTSAAYNLVRLRNREARCSFLTNVRSIRFQRVHVTPSTAPLLGLEAVSAQLLPSSAKLCAASLGRSI